MSCANTIFATQEMINCYLQEGSRVYMCLYALQKAFDSVEFPVLLKRLFDVGVNSKTWHHYVVGTRTARVLYISDNMCHPPFPLDMEYVRDTLTSFVLACYGSSPKTTPVSVYWYLNEQHLRRWISTCGWHLHTCLLLNNSGSTDLNGDTVHWG